MSDNRQIKSPLEVSSNTQFSGQANGGGMVRAGAHLLLSGQMNGRLIIEPGASAQVSGQLNGTAEVMGTLHVTGQLHGLPQVASSGRLTFAVGSSIVRDGRVLVVSDEGEFQSPPSGYVYEVRDDALRWFYQHDGTLRAEEQ